MKRFLLLLSCSLALLLSFPSPSLAQQNSVWCSANCDTTISCDTDFRVPDACLGSPSNCCRILYPADASGTFNCPDQFVACVPKTIIPPPPPPCNNSTWTCQTIDNASCSFLNGSYTPCSDTNNNPGTCCFPPPQTLNACTIAGGYCRPPSEQTVSGSCEWNEIPISAKCTGDPAGTLCCDSATVAKCLSDGHCASACASDETAWKSVNQCQSSGQQCCLPNSNASGGPSPLCGKDNLGVQTAIGCLMAGDPKQLVSQLLGWGVTVGGGIAFLMIVIAGFQMTTASGDPKKVQAARELLMSAIAGLILIVISLVLLNFIGVSVLGLDKIGFSVSL